MHPLTITCEQRIDERLGGFAPRAARSTAFGDMRASSTSVADPTWIAQAGAGLGGGAR